MQKNINFQNSPWMAVWEMTQACDVACLDYGDRTQPELDPLELTTEEGQELIAQVAELGPRIFMLTGADPLKREDIFELVASAADRQLRPVLAIRATPLLTQDSVARLRMAGLSRMVLTLNGSSAALHDRICGVPGSFARTIEATQWADDVRLPFQITTQLSEHNIHDLDALADRIKYFRPTQWNVVFPVPQNQEEAAEMPTGRDFEDAFARLYQLAQTVPFKIKTTEAQHYRRYVLQQNARARANASSQAAEFEEGIPGILPFNEEHGNIFISHTGEVLPCASLHVTLGNVRIQKLADIYQHSTVLQDLRDIAKLKGKCGICGFKQVCGGSRSRAFIMSHELFAEDPNCVYQPPQGSRNAARTEMPKNQVRGKAEK
jgi:radical SAM protein with 4Fe4S-binding SPASM domain